MGGQGLRAGPGEKEENRRENKQGDTSAVSQLPAEVTRLKKVPPSNFSCSRPFRELWGGVKPVNTYTGVCHGENKAHNKCTIISQKRQVKVSLNLAEELRTFLELS